MRDQVFSHSEHEPRSTGQVAGSSTHAPGPQLQQLGPAQIHYLQRTAGNAAVAAFLQRAPVPTTFDPEALFTGVQQILDREEKKAEAITDKLPPHVKSDIAAGHSLEFMNTMRSYLGSDPATEKHFGDIVWAADYVPQAEAYLHKTTAERLGQVSTALEGQVPITYVGQDLRDRYHNRTSRSLMAHPMGYAVDFRAMDNPQIHGDKGKVIRKLIELMGGGPAHITILKKGTKTPMAFDSERALIEKMGRASSEGKQLEAEDKAAADDFFNQMDEEFDRMAQASDAFKRSVDAAVLTGLKKEYFTTYRPNQATLATIARELADLDKRGVKTPAEYAQKQSWLGQQVALQSQQASFRSRLATVLQPWTDRVASALADNEAKVKSVGFAPILNVPSREELAKMKKQWADFVRERATERKEAMKKAKAAEKKLNKARAAKNPKPEEIAQLQADLDSATRQALVYGWIQKADEAERADLDQIDPLLDDRDVLLQLQAALATDMDFVFGPKLSLGGNDERSVKNPPLEQIARRGYFTPDASTGGGPPKTQSEQLKRSEHEWFNKAFFKMMAQYGFQPGADWPGATDPMHFELVEGVDALLPAIRPQKETAPASAPASAPATAH